MLPIKKIRNRLIALALGIAYYFLFWRCYRDLIAPIYSYMGMKFWMMPDWWWYLSLGLALAPLLWLSLDLKRPSDLACWVIYLLFIFPSNIVIPMVSTVPPAEVVKLQIVLMANFVLFDLVRTKYSFKIFRRAEVSRQVFEFGLISLTIALIMANFYLSGFQLRLSWGDIYERRMAARDLFGGLSMLGYGLSMLRSAFVPLLIGIGLQRKKWSYLALAGLAALTIFSLDGQKGALFLPLALVAAAYLVFYKKANYGLWFLALITCLVGLSLLETAVNKSTFLSSVVIRRDMAGPGQSTYNYWEFFSHNPYVMMTDGVIGRFLPFDPPYNIAKARLIGYEYFRDIGQNANANIWASGFADFGYPGMIIVSVLAALILRIIDGLSIKDNFLLGCLCCFAIGQTWINGALQTSLLSNGIAAIIVLLWIIPGHSQPLLRIVSGSRNRLKVTGINPRSTKEWRYGRLTKST